MKTVIELAREVLDQMPPDDHCRQPYWTATDKELERFAELVRADAIAEEREAIYKMVLLDTLKDPDLLMPESEVDDNDADDYFKSSEFRYAMNNVVKSTIFTITANIRARRTHELL